MPVVLVEVVVGLLVLEEVVASEDSQKPVPLVVAWELQVLVVRTEELPEAVAEVWAVQ
jgi:hypothetical protein